VGYPAEEGGRTEAGDMSQLAGCFGQVWSHKHSSRAATLLIWDEWQ